jgi:hypothetical protein
MSTIGKLSSGGHEKQEKKNGLHPKKRAIGYGLGAIGKSKACYYL